MERPPIEIPEPGTPKTFCSVSQSPRSILFQHGYPPSPTLSVDSSQRSIPMSPQGLSPPPTSPELNYQAPQLNSGCPSNLRSCSSLQTMESHHLDALVDVKGTTTGQPSHVCCQHFPKSPTGPCLQKKPCSVISPTQTSLTEKSNPSQHQSHIALNLCEEKCNMTCWQQLTSRGSEGHTTTHVSVGRSLDDSISRVLETPRGCYSAPSTPNSEGVEMFTTDGGDLPGFQQGENVLVRCNHSKWLVGQVRRLSYNGLRVWIRSARTLVNIPLPLLASHAAKLDGSRLHLASNSSCYSSFTSTASDLRPVVHFVRPAHLAHRKLYHYTSEQVPKPTSAVKEVTRCQGTGFHWQNGSALSNNISYDPDICGPLVNVRGPGFQASPQVRMTGSTSGIRSFDFYKSIDNPGQKVPSYPIPRDVFVERPKEEIKPDNQGNTNMLISRAANPCLNEFMNKADIIRPPDIQVLCAAEYDRLFNIHSFPYPDPSEQRSQQTKEAIPHLKGANSAASSHEVFSIKSSSVRTLPSAASMRPKDTGAFLHIKINDAELGGQPTVVKFCREYPSQHSVRQRHSHLLAAVTPVL